MISLQFLLRLAAAALFIVTGVLKLFVSSPLVFADQIGAYELLPSALVLPMAFFLPWFEIVLGVMLLMRQSSRQVAQLMIGLMLVFTLAVVTALLRGLDISCGCFGDASTPVTWWKVAQNSVIIALMSILYRLERKN